MTRWTRARILELERRLVRFREACRPTTLAEVEHASRSPYALLVSCVISLRTRDQVTAVASRRLLELAPDPGRLAALPERTIAKAIYPAGFYPTKARQLRQIGRTLEERHGGAVPADEAALLALPGVGRKTANLVLGLAFGIPAICVDTHVHRISNRLGVVETSSPHATELALQTALPRALWIPINDLLVTFGQNRCHPVSPRCTGCPLDDLCPRIGVTRHR
ncbi:MAG TPA: endonuclease III [Thermoanaerobaculales bacterium]|nr:endonuclease III [Thermoanaerobaculales bacterium]HQN96528.1 endonuclease III [Thermoanaerobaculales bacterium]HQP44069.1 endonuclease III [Thermoanaerobaculales bacterium]